MRIEHPVHRFLSHTALLFALCGALYANAGIEVNRFGYEKFVFSNPGLNTSFIDTFEGGGPLVNPGASFGWLARVGTVTDEDEDTGLHLKPFRRGTPLTIGGHLTVSQIFELQTALTGSSAINNELNTDFVVYGVYRLNSFMRDDVVAGIGLTDAFRGGTRAIGSAVWRDSGDYYAKFFDPLAGTTLDWDKMSLPASTEFVELFIRREHPGSNSVIGGYGFRDLSFGLLDVRFFDVTYLAFSDVVLHPVIFAAALVPEPKTWALMIAGLALVGYLVASQRR